MRILLSQSAYGLSPSCGGSKANWALLKGYQNDNHTVKLLANVSRKEMEKENVTKFDTTAFQFGEDKINTYTFEFDGIQIVAYDSDDMKRCVLNDHFFPTHRRWLKCNENEELFSGWQDFFNKVAQEYKPTHYFCNDSTALKLSESIGDTSVRIFVIHSTEHLPFGPSFCVPEGLSGTKSEAETERLARVDSIWSVSKAIGEYALEYGGLEYTLVPIHPTIYGKLPDALSNWDAEFVVAINPGLLKGFPILDGLARDLPAVKFAAVTSWNFTPYLARELSTLKNVTILPTFADMDELWKQTKILLVPTLCFEAFGLVVVEAMLRGIPVLASDQGGLVEAKLGVEYTIPAVPLTPLLSIEKEEHGDTKEDKEQSYKVDGYLVPKQNTEPWKKALEEILGDKARYDEIAKKSREASVEYVEGIDRAQYSRILQELWQHRFGTEASV